MATCKYCGTPLPENAKFCSRCGKPTDIQTTVSIQATTEQNVQSDSYIRKYTGVSRQIPFVNGLMIEVSAGRDAMNEYTRQFRRYVNDRMRSFQQEYRRSCKTFDGYMNTFVDLNGAYVREAADEAIGLLMAYGYYNYTLDDILNYFQETGAFKKLDDFHNNNIELGQAYLEDNYNNALNKVNRMPNQMFFGTGLSGMAFSYGLSAATGAINNKRANKIINQSQKLTPAQEKEFFSIVKEVDVMYLVWDELINIGNIAINILAGIDDYLVYWPYQSEIDDATKLLENMQNRRFPDAQFASAAKHVLEEFPYLSGLYDLLRQKLGNIPQVDQIEQYFYDPNLFRFSRVFPEYNL